MPAFKWDEDKGTKYRWLVYGVPGAGKTTLAGMLKGKTYLLSLDDSFHRIKIWQNKPIWAIDPEKPIEDLTEFVREFKPEEYDNLVIDNVSNLQKLWFIEKARDSKTGLDNKIQHYGEFTNWLIRLISKLFSYNINIFVTACHKVTLTIKYTNACSISWEYSSIRRNESKEQNSSVIPANISQISKY